MKLGRGHGAGFLGNLIQFLDCLSCRRLSIEVVRLVPYPHPAPPRGAACPGATPMRLMISHCWDMDNKLFQAQ